MLNILPALFLSAIAGTSIRLGDELNFISSKGCDDVTIVVFNYIEKNDQEKGQRGTLIRVQGILIKRGNAEDIQPQPYFDINTALNVSAHIGKSAFLSCIVHNVGNMSVSWVRHRDIHILTVGAYTYTSDQRFMSLHKKDSNEWTLQIKWVQKRDSGMYECQVSSIPVMSLFVHLSVVVPSAVIHGTSDVHIEHGSTINLTCSINYGTEPPAYIFWYHHDKGGKVAVVNYDSDRGGISVITVKAEVSTSHLVIRGAQEADAGKYYCSPSNADVAYVHVHVHSSKGPSAIQTSTGTLGNSYFLMVFSMVLISLKT